MSEQKFSPPEAEIPKQFEIMKRPEYAQACKNTKRGGDIIRELLKLGVPEAEVKTFALAHLEKNIRAGYGLDTVRIVAKQGGVITEVEVDGFFEQIKAKMLEEISTETETEEERVKRDAEEVEEMLKLYE